jgi:hypothetical protein
MSGTAVRALVTASAAVTFLAGILAWTPVGADEAADRSAAAAAATQEATTWLDALDAHRYADSWSDAAAVMREGRTQDDWTRDIGARESFGKALIRELRSAEYSTSVRGGPQGKYVTATYLTQFTNAPPAIETILVTLEDGRWRIAGYTIARAPTPPPAPDKPGTDSKSKAKE